MRTLRESILSGDADIALDLISDLSEISKFKWSTPDKFIGKSMTTDCSDISSFDTIKNILLRIADKYKRYSGPMAEMRVKNMDDGRYSVVVSDKDESHGQCLDIHKYEDYSKPSNSIVYVTYCEDAGLQQRRRYSKHSCYVPKYVIRQIAEILELV